MCVQASVCLFNFIYLWAFSCEAVYHVTQLGLGQSHQRNNINYYHGWSGTYELSTSWFSICIFKLYIGRSWSDNVYFSSQGQVHQEPHLAPQIHAQEWVSIAVPTRLIVVHPVEHDFWGSVPPGGHVASHFWLCGSGQPKVQNLELTVLINCYITRFKVLLGGRKKGALLISFFTSKLLVMLMKWIFCYTFYYLFLT